MTLGRFMNKIIFIIIMSLEVDTDIYNEVVAAAGDNVTLECHESADNDVTWQYQKTPDHPPDYVYYIGTHYQLRFNVDHSIVNQYNLNIDSATVSDSGRYLCVEDGGQGKRHVYDLAVIGERCSFVYSLKGFPLVQKPG